MVTVFSSMAVIAPRKRTGVVCAEAVKLRPRTTAASRPAMKRMVVMVLLLDGSGTLAREIRTDRLRLREADRCAHAATGRLPSGWSVRVIASPGLAFAAMPSELSMSAEHIL